MINRPTQQDLALNFKVTPCEVSRSADVPLVKRTRD